jgi:hypothetical protein
MYLRPRVCGVQCPISGIPRSRRSVREHHRLVDDALTNAVRGERVSGRRREELVVGAAEVRLVGLGGVEQTAPCLDFDRSLHGVNPVAAEALPI